MVASKFTTSTAERVLQATAVGCSQETASAVAGINQATLSRWLTRGRKELEEALDPDNVSVMAKFARDYDFAAAAPRERALGIIYREMDTNPALAWKFIERREPGFAPPMPQAHEPAAGPVIIQLSLADGSPVGAFAPQTVVDVTGGVSESDDTGDTPAADAADADSPTAVLSLAERGSE